MSLQRGADIKGWEGVTRNLAASPEERHTWQVSIWALLLIVFVTGLVALLVSHTEMPTVAKALMIGLSLLGTMVLMSSTYSKMIERAQEKGAKAADARSIAAVARHTAPATIEPAAAPATPPVARDIPEPAAAPAPEPVQEPTAEAEPELAPEPVADADANRPEALDGPRDGGDGDDLTLIKGIGPALKKLCNSLGFWHFDQIASWTDTEVAWVDENLEGFKGRVTRDQWVDQAKILAAGGETEFSARQ